MAERGEEQQLGSRATRPRKKRSYRAPTVVTIGVLAQLMLAGTHSKKKADEGGISR